MKNTTENSHTNHHEVGREEREKEPRKEKEFFFYNFSFYNLKYPEFVWSYGARSFPFEIEFYLRVETASIIQGKNTFG